MRKEHLIEAVLVIQALIILALLQQFVFGE
jgi:hypothetical protein